MKASADGESFSESKFWVDSKERIVRSEDRGGLVRNGTPRFEEIETYEYDPTIKIEAPAN